MTMSALFIPNIPMTFNRLYALLSSLIHYSADIMLCYVMLCNVDKKLMINVTKSNIILYTILIAHYIER